MARRSPLPALFIKSACDYQGDDCLIWPYAKARKYGKLYHAGKVVIAHRLVCRIAHGEPPTPKHQAAHKCGVHLCVTPRHLRWATQVENEADKLAHGMHRSGEQKPEARLTADAVRIIRKQPERTCRDLGVEYGVSAQTVCKARLRQTWKGIEEEVA